VNFYFYFKGNKYLSQSHTLSKKISIIRIDPKWFSSSGKTENAYPTISQYPFLNYFGSPQKKIRD